MRSVVLFAVFITLFFQTFKGAFGQSLGDTIKLQTVQVLASKIPGKSYETRSSIDSLTLAKSSTIRLSELLSQNTPIFIKEYGRGAMATASFRGTAPSHTKVTWNGLELNSPMLGMVDFSLIPVYFTEGVTLLHGTSSLTEAAGALGGTILLDNKANWSNSFSGKLLSGYGSYGTYDDFGQFSIGNKKVQSKSAVYYNSSQNDFTFLNKMNADIDPSSGAYIYPTEKNKYADYENHGLLQELYFQITKNQIFSLKTWLQYNERSIPQLLTNESNEAANINRQTENAIRSVAEWKRIGLKSRLAVLTSFNYQSSAYKLENSVSGNSNQIVVNANALITTSGNKLSYRYQIDQTLTLLSDFDMNFHKVNTQNRLPNLQSSGYNQTKIENSFFSSLEKQWNSQWTSTFLIREVINDFKHMAFLPLLRFSYQPFLANSLRFTASGARNVHTPTLNDLYFIPGGNPLLRSEKSKLYDFGITDDFLLGQNQIKTGISLYSSTTEDWIIWLPTFQGYWEPTNIKSVISRGFEANAAWAGKFGPVRSWVKANYAFTRTINQSIDSPAYGKQLPYIPENSANLNIHLAMSGFYFYWVWNYYSKRFTTTANSVDTVSDYLYPYFMNNIQFGRDFRLKSCKIVLDLKINNLLNENYRTVLQRPMPGRNYQIVVSYEF